MDPVNPLNPNSAPIPKQMSGVRAIAFNQLCRALEKSFAKPLFCPENWWS
ncbi:MAG: hypothetical protein ING02_16995 [Roseomonas sp.]|nr:hypothetical protein [Roseomonas sp.]